MYNDNKKKKDKPGSAASGQNKKFCINKHTVALPLDNMNVPTMDGIFQLVMEATVVIIVCDGEHQKLVITLAEFSWLTEHL